MARARNLKPGFFANEDLAECSFEARLLFAGLWCLADRDGRLEDRPKRIKGEIFRFDSIDVEACLNELAKHRFIRRYKANGDRYIDIPNFAKHQNPHRDEKSRNYPACTMRAPCKPGVSTEARRLDPYSLNPSSLNEDSLSPEPSDVPSEADSPQAVLDAWNATPGTRPAKALAGKRLTALKARLKEPAWLGTWQAALGRFPLKLFASEPEGWQPDLDWFVRPDTAGKILEGKYDWTKAAGNGKPQRESVDVDAIDFDAPPPWEQDP